jgi:hypothetical protein
VSLELDQQDVALGRITWDRGERPSFQFSSPPRDGLAERTLMPRSARLPGTGARNVGASRLQEVAGILPKPVEQVIRIFTNSTDAGPAQVSPGPFVDPGGAFVNLEVPSRKVVIGHAVIIADRLLSAGPAGRALVARTACDVARRPVRQSVRARPMTGRLRVMHA